jgi:PAS domain S-box-containing protein
MKNTFCGNIRSLIDWSDSIASIATQTLEKMALPLPNGAGRETAGRLRAGANGRSRRDGGLSGRALFENWPEAVFLLDPHDCRVIGPAVECNAIDWEHGGAVRRFAWTLEWPIIECNAAACRLHGYRRNQLLGQPIGALGPLTTEPAVLMNLHRDLESRDIVRFLGLHRGRDGACFPVEASASLVRLGGRELVIMLSRESAQKKQPERQTGNLETWESIGRMTGVTPDFNGAV